MLRSALEAAGVAVQQPGDPGGQSARCRRGHGDGTAVGSAAAGVVARRPRSRAAAPSVRRCPPHEQADRRVAAAALDFLREQPDGDGSGFRSWIATTAVFAEPGSDVGVELLTFHAAKGREWHTVVVTGVETGLVPHRSATTLDAKAEEARLLHVAMTRAGDQLLVTYAERRRGYARKPSPFIVGLPTEAVAVVAPPPSSTTRPTSSPCAPIRCSRGGARLPAPPRCCRRRSAPMPTSRRSPRPRRRAPTSCRRSRASAR